MNLSEKQLADLKFRLRVSEKRTSIPDSHTMPDPKFDTHKIDPSTDMLIGEIKKHSPQKIK